jgi:hypothetical protein
MPQVPSFVSVTRQSTIEPKNQKYIKEIYPDSVIDVELKRHNGYRFNCKVSMAYRT